MEKIKYDLEELHKVQLDLFVRLKKVCEENSLTYFMAFGSLLGAVREKGIIPWDDSIDVVMPYQDYEKLLGLPTSVWGNDFFLQTYDTDPQYPKCYAKLRDSRTTLIKSDYTALDINHGIHINIMPLISLADDPDLRRKQIKDAQLYKAVTEGSEIPSNDVPLKLYSSILMASSEQGRAKTREKLKAKVTRYEGENTKDCFALAGNVSLTLALPKEWFKTARSQEFEGMTVNIPNGWDEWLRLRYGEYLVVPISDIQGDKISNFVTLNAHKPYTFYKGKTYCTEG